MRAAIAILLPLLLPLAAFMLWRAMGMGKAVPGWLDEVPWVSLLAIGMVLAALSLGTWAIVGGAEPGAQYHSPVYKDGKIIPGGFDK